MQKKGKDGDDSSDKLKKFSLEASNKRCFDCGQRGPTYINVTIGAFVCSSCGGLLRGLATPQRIKSISMAKFSPAEVESVLQRGNEVCRSIWLGKWEKADPPTFDKASENGRKDFLYDKYEKKLWYVDPSVATVPKEQPETKSLKQIAEKRSSPIAVPRARGSSVTPPLSKSLSLSSPPTNNRQPAAAARHPAVTKQASLQSVTPTQPRPPAAQPAAAVTPQPAAAPPPQPSVDDMFSASPAANSVSGGFANFDATPTYVSTASFLQPQSSGKPSPSGGSQWPVGGGAVPTTPLSAAPISATPLSATPPTKPKGGGGGGGEDRYAALADLDNTLRSLTFTSNSGFSCTSQSVFDKGGEPEPTPPARPARTPQPQQQFHSNNPFTQGVDVYGGQLATASGSSIMSTGHQVAYPGGVSEEQRLYQQQLAYQQQLMQQQMMVQQQQQQQFYMGGQPFQPAQSHNPFMQAAAPAQFQSNPFK